MTDEFVEALPTVNFVLLLLFLLTISSVVIVVNDQFSC